MASRCGPCDPTRGPSANPVPPWIGQNCWRTEVPVGGQAAVVAGRRRRLSVSATAASGAHRRDLSVRRARTRPLGRDDSISNAIRSPSVQLRLDPVGLAAFRRRSEAYDAISDTSSAPRIAQRPQLKVRCARPTWFVAPTDSAAYRTPLPRLNCCRSTTASRPKPSCVSSRCWNKPNAENLAGMVPSERSKSCYLRALSASSNRLSY